MSASIHHLPTRHDAPTRAVGDADRPEGRGVWAAALGALAAALVPGRAEEETVPAVHAADAQALLRRSGHLSDRHRTDRWDRQTANAVARFQRRRRLPVSGVCDAATADALMRDAGEDPEPHPLAA